jgi:hypothetical protein
MWNDKVKGNFEKGDWEHGITKKFVAKFLNMWKEHVDSDSKDEFDLEKVIASR